MNYFELFGMQPKPSADNTYVSKKYISLQKENHPDYFENDEDAMNRSADINKAYATFKNKDLTLKYFLEQHGMLSGEDPQLDQGFLMEMMDLNDLIDEENADAAKVEADRILIEMHAAVDPLLHAEKIDWSQQELETLKDFYYRKKYLQRVLDRIT